MIDLTDLRVLPVDERLRLIEELWDSIDVADEALPLPDWHRAEIDRRLDKLNSGASVGASWQEVRRRIVGAP